MSIIEEYEIQTMIVDILSHAIGSEYASAIGDDTKFVRDVIDDVLVSSAWSDDGHYNDDDIKLAIGRVLLYRLGIWY